MSSRTPNSPGPITLVVFAYHDVGYECLDVLIGRRERIAAVFTHEDNPGERIWFRSVAELAERHGIPVHRPASVNTPDWIAHIRALEPALIFSFYYRNMICQEILDVPALGALNMHGSLLPKYRGRVPINWAVLKGETETGVTLHYMVKRADAGDIVDQQAVPIGPRETAFEIFHKVTAAARIVLERQIENLKQGRAPRLRQVESEATYFGGRTPEDGRIDWTQSAASIFNLIRAVTHPYPGAFTTVEGRRLYIWRAEPVPSSPDCHYNREAGTICSTAPLRVSTHDGCLEITSWQWEGEKEEVAGPPAAQPSASAGHGLRVGQRLGGTAATRPSVSSSS
jgi:methionyl-tRNA formyltransferase